MQITEISTGLKKAIIIKEAWDEDFKALTKKRYSFSWKELKQTVRVYQLQIAGEEDILGVMGVTDVPLEKRIEIKLLASSVENIGKGKTYEGIPGCLIAHACRLAKMGYGELACVSLIPKTALKLHYIKKYMMTDAGWQLYLEGKPLNDIIIKYLV